MTRVSDKDSGFLGRDTVSMGMPQCFKALGTSATSCKNLKTCILNTLNTNISKGLMRLYLTATQHPTNSVVHKTVSVKITTLTKQ